MLPPKPVPVQAAAKRFQEADGDMVVGYKVGCTSPLIQQKLGISHPVRGYLWKSQQHGDQARLPLGSFRSLAIEGELAVTVLTTHGPVDQWQVWLQLWLGHPQHPAHFFFLVISHVGSPVKLGVAAEAEGLLV